MNPKLLIQSLRNLTILMFIFFPGTFFAQQKTDTTEEKKKTLPYYIEICTDKMTDKSYAFGSKTLLCSEDGKKGFGISVSWDNKNGEITYRGISVISAGIGNCVEKSTLILLFEDDTKTQITAWNNFNCEGKSYMDWQGKSYNNIFGKKVKTIRFTNGRSYDSYTYNLNETEQNYFIEAASALSEKRIVNSNCDN